MQHINESPLTTLLGVGENNRKREGEHKTCKNNFFHKNLNGSLKKVNE